MNTARSVGQCWAVVCAGLLLLGHARGLTLTFQEGAGGYTGTQDTHISNVSGQQSTDNSAQVWTRMTGQAGEGDTNKQTPLLRFDGIIGPGAGQIPAGAGITSAILTLRPGDTFTAATDLFRLLVAWNETDSWNSSFGGNGVDYSGGVEALATPDASVSSFSAAAFLSLDVTAGVQAWALGAPNYGWAFINQVAIGPNYIPFASSENGAALRPLLTVDFVIPEPATGALLVLAAGAGAFRRPRERLA